MPLHLTDATLRALISCATQSASGDSAAMAVILLIVGLALCAIGTRLVIRLSKTPRISARDLARHPLSTPVRVRAAVHSSDPLIAQLVDVPLLYSRVQLLERRRLQGKSREYEDVEIASRPAEWAEDCFLQDQSGRFPLRWGELSPRLVEESQSRSRRQAGDDPRIADLFTSFMGQDCFQDEISTPLLKVCESFIPEGGTFMLWGHRESDPAVPEETFFRVTEISPPHAASDWARACAAIALGIAVTAASLLMGYQGLTASPDGAIPVYGPPSGPTPLKP